MSGFWSVSIFWGIVLLSIGVALAVVLWPLFRREGGARAVDGERATLAIYRDQLAELKSDLERGEIAAQEYEDARLEIEKRVSEELPRAAQAAPAPAGPAARRAGYILAGLIPVATIALYALFGNPAALGVAPASAAANPGEHELAAMISTLEAKMEENPGDPTGWVMLGRSYEAVERNADAELAFARAVALVPDDAGVLADYAEAVALNQGGLLAGKPVELLQQALKLNPAEQKALELSAFAAGEAGDFAKEAGYWRRLQQTLPPESEHLTEVIAAAERAEQAAGAGGWRKPSRTAPTPSGGVVITGTVQLDPALRDKVDPADTVWIIAKAPDGTMPLSIVKITAGELPYRFTLDDSNAMMAGDTLAKHPRVNLTARVSKSGDATARSGDLQGTVNSVKAGQQKVSIIIDTVVR